MNQERSINTRSSKKLYWAIILSQIVTLYPLLGLPSMQFVSLANYFLMTIATVLLIVNVAKNHIEANISQKLFFIWVIYIYIYAVPVMMAGYMNYLYLKRFLTFNLFLYAIPLFMIMRIDESFLKSLFKFIYILACVYIIVVITGGGRSEMITMLAEGTIILLMTLPYHSQRKRTIIVITVALCVILMMLSVRRNKVVYFGGGFALAYFINLFSKNSDSRVRKSKKTWIIVALFLIVGILGFATSFSAFFDKMNTGMESRDVVIEFFFADFNSQKTDWITGRGMYGEFYAGLANVSDENTNLRDGIENGYLYLILKGGLIWVALLALFSVKSIYLGLIKSNNLLCKGFAMIILLYFVDMIGFGIPQTSLKYIMVFISIAGCNTKWLRECSDTYLANQIGLK